MRGKSIDGEGVWCNFLDVEMSDMIRTDVDPTQSWNPGNLGTELYRHTGAVGRVISVSISMSFFALSLSNYWLDG